MNFQLWYTHKHSAVPAHSIQAVLDLAGEGATVPFIARYRKERTGNLDEVAIRNIIEANEEWVELGKRKIFVLGEIEKQGKLTDELKKKIETCFESNVLEDLYLPYKQKRKTKAQIARENGLEPLAQAIAELGRRAGGDFDQEAMAKAYLNEKITDTAAALQGANDILVEGLSENAELRAFVREATLGSGGLISKKGPKAEALSKYEKYFEYAEPMSSLLQPEASHRYMAMRRGWLEEELTLSIGGRPDPEGGDSGFEAHLLERFEQAICPEKKSAAHGFLAKVARLALRASVLPSISSEMHKMLKDSSDLESIRVFSENVRRVLLASPLGPRPVIAIDPGIRTGCKVVSIDAAGKYELSGLLHLQSEREKEEASASLLALLKARPLAAIAIGNGTAGRETEVFVRALLKKESLTQVPVIVVNETGASVYSASDVAREEFPDLDVTVRGAISIGRRLQDPLAELVKVDPKSLGVGQYQHDINAVQLKKSLEGVVDSCVNAVGVDLNTASPYLLARVSGIGPSLAKAVVERRQSKGLFKSKAELRELPRFSDKIFEQAAGFLRIRDGQHPFENTGVHPERYASIESAAQRLGKELKELMGEGAKLLEKDSALKKELGDFTFNDIVQELAKPGRDPREAFEVFEFREDVSKIEDLQVGMQLPGIVTNVTNFGAFVDVGVHQDGLVHISQLADRFVKNPAEFVQPGQKVHVRVTELDVAKKRISLSMRSPERVQAPRSETPTPRPSHQGRPASRPQQGRPPQDFRDRNAHHRDARPPMEAPRSKPAPRRESFSNNPFAALAALSEGGKKEKRRG